jgi:hypothetical protein
MKFVYPFHNESGTFEITHSIRLVKKYFPNAEIFVIGDNPKIDGVTVIPFVQVDNVRGANFTKKVLHFAKMNEGDFVLMNDDFFISDKFRPELVLHGNELTPSDKYSQGYNNSVINSLEMLKHNGLQTINFERHQPTLFNCEKLAYLFKQIDVSQHHFVKSIYHNVYHGEYKYLRSDNLKLAGYKEKRARLYLDTFGSFSISDTFLTDEGKQFIQSL